MVSRPKRKNDKFETSDGDHMNPADLLRLIKEKEEKIEQEKAAAAALMLKYDEIKKGERQTFIAKLRAEAKKHTGILVIDEEAKTLDTDTRSRLLKLMPKHKLVPPVSSEGAISDNDETSLKGKSRLFAWHYVNVFGPPIELDEDEPSRKDKIAHEAWKKRRADANAPHYKAMIEKLHAKGKSLVDYSVPQIEAAWSTVYKGGRGSDQAAWYSYWADAYEKLMKRDPGLPGYEQTWGLLNSEWLEHQWTDPDLSTMDDSHRRDRLRELLAMIYRNPAERKDQRYVVAKYAAGKGQRFADVNLKVEIDADNNLILIDAKGNRRLVDGKYFRSLKP